MRPKDAFELRDPDGTYVVARPLSRGRCLVLLSNLYSTGDILQRSDVSSWRDAASEDGAGTWLSPHELASCEEDDAGPASLEDLQDDEDVLRETHDVVSARTKDPAPPWTLRQPESASKPAEAEPTALALRLMIHYLVVHVNPWSATREVEVCRCDRYSPGPDLTLASLHAIVYTAVRHKTGPGLGRIQRAIRRAVRALNKKETQPRRSTLAA
jgi:hypothetical protein